MRDNPYLQDHVTTIIGKMNHEELFEVTMQFVYNTTNEDLEEMFAADLEDNGYNFEDHE